MALKKGGAVGVRDGFPVRLSDDITETDSLFTQLKELVMFIEQEMQEKQEELSVLAEELEAQNDELREKNEILQKSEETSSRLAAIVESSDDAIISKSMDGTIMSWNTGAERMFDYSAREVIGKNVSILVPPGHPDEIPGILKKITKGMRVEHYETVRMRRDGTLIDVSVTVSPLKDKSGVVVGASSIKRDITIQKQMEKELQEKQENLEIMAEELKVQNEELRTNNIDLEEAKMQSELFLDLMGHDISNMHHIAMGQLELAEEILNEEGSIKIKDKELIKTPLEILERSARLIENVQNLQKLRSGEFKEEVIDITALLSSIVEEYEPIMPSQAIKFVGSGMHCVKANKLLHDVFTNLVGNAIKHANEKDVNIVIMLKNARVNGKKYYKVSVEDNGPGIPDDVKDKIFNRLQRGQSKARGLGLGLYLVKSLVDSYDGRVWVEDRVKGDHTKGSRFVVILPVMRDSHVC